MSRSCTATDSFSPAPATNKDDRTLLETEFEAAEVLASLSKSPPPPPSSREASVGGGGESVDSWGSRSKRSSVRVKSESSPVDSALNTAATAVAELEVEKEKKPVLLAFDLNEDQATTFNQNQGATFNQEEECQRGPKEAVKAEDAELSEPSPMCSSPTGGKPRHNLTQAEKEARRLRRVLANRESARQTIRRRQALYEELSRKVVDLEKENENLKKDKESGVEDYETLKCTNKKLNEEVAELLGSKLEENQGKSTSSCSVPPLPFSNYPYIISKDAPFVHPYNIQLPDHMNPTQLSQYGYTRQSEATLSEASNSESPNGKGKPLSINGTSGHWCMVPCPIFFPMPDVKNEPNLIPLFPTVDKGNETCVDNTIEVKKEVSTLVEAQPRTTTYETPLGFALDSVEDTSMGIKLTGVAPCSEAISSKGGLQESHKEPAVRLGKRLVDPVAAAGARKRRKELTRLKSLHCRARRKEGPRLGESHPSLTRNA